MITVDAIFVYNVPVIPSVMDIRTRAEFELYAARAHTLTVETFSYVQLSHTGNMRETRVHVSAAEMR